MESHSTTNRNTVDENDVVSLLPLQLIKSEIIPPSPNRSKSHTEFEPAIDWQPNFCGYSWIAYGATSLLVIRQLPNPNSPTETVIGTVFQQVIELSIDGAGVVSAVAWSPVMPCCGELAVALDNCIGLFSYNSNASNSSFCWSQTSTLVQSTKVDSITWTGSGDGIISGGIELILWRKKERSWEIAWRFKPELPQTLISATWSIEGPFAAAPPYRLHVEGSDSHIYAGNKCVFVCQRDADSRNLEAILPHPLPVSMIQWRPSTVTRSTRDGRHSRRLVLLTCCLDGAARLWTEIDDGRVRKVGKDSNEHKVNKFSFRVVAVIEVNQALNGRLGLDVYVRWATDINGIITVNGEAVSYSSADEHQHGNAGRCEWLIAVGPQTTLTFWAIHCLDDFSPVRAPRVTLWKRKELSSHNEMPRGLLLNKVFIMRNQVFGPPAVCSFINLLPSNYLAWMQFYSSKLPNGAKVSSELISTDDPYPNKCQTECLLSLCGRGLSNMDSHSSKILQVAVHPCLSELEIAASLDTDGKLLFWFFSSASNTMLGLPTLSPSWKLLGKGATSVPQPKYTSLRWVPTLLSEERILVIGHADGIDFLLVKAVKTKELDIVCHKICTIPLTAGSQEQGPDSVFSIPLPSTCNKTFISNSFLLLAVWKKAFQALSWKIYLHHYDLSGSRCGCSFDSTNTFQNNTLKFESSYSGKAYLVSVEPCSSVFPDPRHHDKISSSAVICPTNSGCSEELFANNLYSNYFAYHMVTGCFDGSLQLWRSVPAASSNSLWDLVGTVALCQGPILAISASVSGRKIATVSKEGPLSTSTTIHIWECVRVEGAGSFILEDTLYFDADVVSSNWLTIGNGQFLLGVCSRNKLHVYAQKRCGGQCILEPERSLEGDIWVCLAASHTNPTIQDFFWGPKAMIVVVHDEYISVFSKFSYFMDKKLLPQLGGEACEESSVCHYGSDKVPVFLGDENCDNAQRQSDLPLKLEVVNETSLFSSVRKSKEGFTSVKNGIWSILEIAEVVGGSIPLVHPEAFLVNLLSGNWKRSYVALQSLSKHVTSTKLSAKICCLRVFSGLIFPISLSNYLEGSVLLSSGEKSFQWGGPSDTSSWGYAASDNAFSISSARSEITDFTEAFDKLQNFATISATEMMQIRAAIQLLDEVSNMQSTSSYNSLDGPGRRFWVSVRFQQLYFVQRFGRLPSESELVVYSGLIGWAFHSDCQDNLFDSLLSKQPSWQEMRDMGIGLWYTSVAQLRLKMEKLARQQYLKKKDPRACALLYIALNRLQVLAGLFKISKDEKDKPLVAFLSRNFQEDKNKAAALKNAYVLLGKHQLELAIAFFLLGGDTTSAVTVCVKNLGDEQLALVICRLVEGYGGTLEHYLISKFLLPSALAKGDYWLASVLEWMLGKYPQAYLRMLAFPTGSLNSKCIFSSRQPAFLDPNIGDFCLMLAAKTTMKNAIGEQNAASLSRWAILMRATALSRCGLPLEALECLSSSVSVTGDSNRRSVPDNVDSGCLHEMLSAMLIETSSNWLSLDVAFQIDSHIRSDLSMQYMSKMLRRHPSWVDNDITCLQEHMYTVSENQEYKLLLEAFQVDLMTTVASFQLKFSIIPQHLMYSIFLSFCNRGLAYIGCHLLRDYINRYLSSEQGGGLDGCSLYPCLPELFLEVSGELFYIFARYITMCSMDCFYLKSFTFRSNRADESFYCAIPELYNRRLCWSFWCLRAMMQFSSVSCTENVVGTHFTALDLSEYFLLFASAWVQRNFSVLIPIVKPLLMAKASDERDIKDIQKLLRESLEMMASDLPIHAAGSSVPNKNQMPQVQFGDVILSVPEERWHVMVASFWGYVSSLLKHKLNLLCPELEESGLFLPPGGHPSISTSIFVNGNNVSTHNGMVPGLLAKIVKVTCGHISSYCVNQFASVLLESIDPGASTLFCSEDYQSQVKAADTKLSHNNNDLDKVTGEDELSAFEALWDFCSELKKANQDFVLQDQKILQHTLHKSFKGWSEMYPSIVSECEVDETYDRDERLGSPSSAAGSPLACLSPNNHPFQSFGGKDTHHTKKVLPFRSPIEIYKRNGELLEALCINSIDQHEAALASNRKGLLFFNWEDGLACGNKAGNVWAEADWPHNGWAGSESTPIPTCVSPGVGLGSKKGTHLGLGGATVGAGFLARPTFGLPGYANTGGSSLGWGFQEDFDEFLDPPATVENVRTRAFSTHPSRPFFLVGSNNTHIYLWEFGKDRATATYGVLPAANVPPPYALASVSAVKFDHCGHRFVSAASDGTVCTWQLEVGGRSNVRPTESSLCFNNYTSDATYVTSSGSIIAAAGYSSSGVNVVIWDTLAPPATSRASIMCHEGGARSLAVFDNDLGSGSISPLIVTGGKGGDVGLHDFRYIATGKTKKQKHTEIGDHGVNSMVDTQKKTGDQNRNGMLWYIPKAHAGSVTKISTIPHTSFFLTGSKDGDVKLWDAKNAKLVFHWPKLHERHTFLQPSSRGFGGVVQAAVTDIQIVSHGFVTCGGDGAVKLVMLNDHLRR